MNYKWFTETLGKGLVLLVLLAATGWAIESAYLFYLAPANFFIGVSKIAGLILVGSIASFIVGLVIQGLEKLISKKPTPTPPADPATDTTIPVV